MTEREAKQFVESLKSARENNSDKQASESIGIYPTMHYDGKAIEAGARIRWGDSLMSAQLTIWDLEENNPDNHPTFWKKIMYKDGIRIIDPPIAAVDAFHLNELAWWNDEIYKSLIEGNVYTPDDAHAVWEIQLREVI